MCYPVAPLLAIMMIPPSIPSTTKKVVPRSGLTEGRGCTSAGMVREDAEA